VPRTRQVTDDLNVQLRDLQRRLAIVEARAITAITTAVASTLSGVNAEGSAASLARSDHDHAVLSTSGASVLTAQGTSSTTYTDLATAGPSVTVDVPASGLVRVSIYCSHSSNDPGAIALMSFEVTGGNSVAAADVRAIGHVGNTGHRNGFTFLLTGLNVGSTTFTAKYRGSATFTATFSDRQIHVEPVLT
jgi:hypothetical protein